MIAVDRDMPAFIRACHNRRGIESKPLCSGSDVSDVRITVDGVGMARCAIEQRVVNVTKIVWILTADSLEADEVVTVRHGTGLIEEYETDVAGSGYYHLLSTARFYIGNPMK